ncbi:MAG TPA: 50S ribosomal protein L29 [Bacteroidales bacterium]|nr:50S ribosomal protein L29 [Bacteroidales bacterium]HOX76479.1 50S ribosomal protein L29 [Bacteroidales bacterium]
MKQKVIIEMTNEELRERLEDEKKQLVKMKLAHAVSPLDNPHKMKEYKRTVARLLTEIRRREIDAEKNK